jgi:hypothetical protein
MDSGILDTVARWEQAQAELAALDVSALSGGEALEIHKRLEIGHRRQPVINHKLIHQMQTQSTPAALGARTWPKVLAEALRISEDEARKRIKDAAVLGPRRALTGEPLAPVLPRLAAAQARGQVGVEHVRIIEKFFTQLPRHIDAATRELAEADLARIATGLGPTQLRAAAQRLALLLNQDGELPDDAERARKRYFTIDKQGPDGMSRCHGLLDPHTAATLEAVLAKQAAPGMCNPEDPTPCVDGDPTAAQAHADTRSQGQRNHDALTAMGRSVLASGELGQHNGLPATIIITAALQDLEAAAGVGVTAGGTLVPMGEVIRLASQAHHWLVVFDKHTRQPLYCGRAKRFATPGQRIVLQALEGGCTKPGCTCPGYRAQVHHLTSWAGGGATNITKLKYR